MGYYCGIAAVGPDLRDTRIKVRPSTRYDFNSDKKFMPRTSVSPSAGVIITFSWRAPIPPRRSVSTVPALARTSPFAVAGIF